MDFEKPCCPIVEVDGNIACGKQFDLDITLPCDNRNVIYGVIRDCYKEPVCDAVVKLVEVVCECGKEERRPVSHTFTDKEGEIILKKYSPIGELTEFASNYAETISKTTGHIACITDKDTVIAVSGGSKKDFLEKNLSKELEEVIENKEVFKSKENNEIAIPITQNEGRERIYNSQVIYPIISDGDVIGSVILLAKDQSKKMGEVEDKIAQSAAGFLGNHLGV